MHRSGTSSLAGAFVKLGATAPKTLLGANEGNAAGHWESASLIDFHDKLLESAGSRWDDWRRFNDAWYETPVAAEYKQRGKLLLQEEFGDASLFVFKDPRNCRIARFWFEIFAEEGVLPRIVIPVRSPLEVAQSHRARDLFPLRKGLVLWLRHVLDAEAVSRGMPRVFVEWDQFLDDWQNSISAMEQALGPFPANTDLTAAGVEQFLRRDLKHQKVSAKQLAESTLVHQWVEKAYAAVKELARNPNSNSACEILDHVKAQFDDAALLLGGVLADAEFEEAQVRSLLQGEKEASHLKDQQLVEQRAARDQAAARIAGLEEEFRAKQQAYEEAVSQLDSASEHQRQTSRLLQQEQETLQAARDSLQSKEVENDQMSKHLTEVQAMRDALQNERNQLSEQLAAREHLAQQLADVQGMRDALQNERNQLSEQLAAREHLAEQLADSQAMRDALQNEHNRLSEQLAAREHLAEQLADAQAMRDALQNEREQLAGQQAELEEKLQNEQRSRRLLADQVDEQNQALSSIRNEKEKLLERLNHGLLRRIRVLISGR
ncbi:hypothetical protein CYK37_00050 [Mesorhizobium loti]|nr:hypothetical protein CYK37_00050 [Mesorhizobium loti]